MDNKKNKTHSIQTDRKNSRKKFCVKHIFKAPYEREQKLITMTAVCISRYLHSRS